MAGEVYRPYPTLWVQPPGPATLPPGGGSVPWTGPRALTVPRSTDYTPTFLPPVSRVVLLPVGGGSVPWTGPRPVDPAADLTPPQTENLRPTFLPPPSIAALMPVGGGAVPWTGPRPVDPASDLTPPQTQDLRPTFLPPPSIAALMPAGGGAVPWTGPRPVDPASDLTPPQTQDLRPTYLPPRSLAAVTPAGGGAVPGVAPPVTAPRSPDFPYWIAGELSEFMIQVPPATFVPANSVPPVFAAASWSIQVGARAAPATLLPIGGGTVPALAQPITAARSTDFPYWIAGELSEFMIQTPATFVPANPMPPVIASASWSIQIGTWLTSAVLLPAGGGSVPWTGPRPVDPASYLTPPQTQDLRPTFLPPPSIAALMPVGGGVAVRLVPPITAPRSPDFPYWIAGELSEFMIQTPLAAFVFAIDRQAAAHRRDPWFAPLARAFFPPPTGVVAPILEKIFVTFDLRDHRITPPVKDRRITFEFSDRRLTAKRKGDA